MNDENSIKTETIKVAYSLPLGFRKKLERVLNDYDNYMWFIASNVYLSSSEERSAFHAAIGRLVGLKDMLEYSRLWDEAQ